MENARILVVEDDPEVATIVKNILQSTGFDVPLVVSNGKAAISATKVFRPDLVLMDIKLEDDIDGIKAAEKIKEMHDVPIIFLTGNSEDNILNIASGTGPLAFIIKPFKSKDLIANVKNALLQKKSTMCKSKKYSIKSKNSLNTLKSYIYTIEITDDSYSFIKHSPECIYVTGYSSEEYISNPVLYYEIVYDDDKQMFIENINRMLCRELVEPFEYRILHKDGLLRWIRNIPIPRHDANGDLFAYDGLIEDITERKDSEEFIKNILEAVDEGFVVLDKDYRIISANKAFCNQVKMNPEIIYGKKCYEVFHKFSKPCNEMGISCGATHVFVHGTSCGADCHYHGDYNNLLYVETKYYPLKNIYGDVVSVIVTIIDRTEKKKLEEQLFHAQKMEALGQFSSSIAHDLNNYLAAMSTYTQILKTKIPKDSPLFKYVNQIILSSDKIAGLARNLIIFGRKQTIDMMPINIFEAIKKSENILSTLAGNKISIEIILKHPSDKYKDLIINGSPDLLEQVLVNLVVNARDAMPDGGVIRIELNTEENNSKFIKGSGFPEVQRYVIISVSDSGTGMDEETKTKIFEPFFTTKEKGKGSGLGLAIVYRIIKEHKGYIDVHSISGKGTTFRIYLPMLEQSLRLQ